MSEPHQGVDGEALLAAAARRLAKLNQMNAAVALADSNISSIELSTLNADIRLVVGGDNYDALRDPDVFGDALRVDHNGDEYLVPSLLKRVFLDVLPPGWQSVEIHIAIRNDAVTPEWRILDEKGQLVAGPKTGIANLDLSKLPNESDLVLHLARLNRLDQEPEEVIGAAKDLVEAAAKLVLITLGEPVASGADVAALSKEALKQLNLRPEMIAPTAKGAETMRRMLAGLQQIAAGLAELRNMGYGTGHGRGHRVQGVSDRHAEFAARAASAYVAFVLATLNEPAAPWRAQRAPTHPKASPARISARTFADGDRVVHERWGIGIVVTSKLTRSDEEITVAFKDPASGRKTMLASLAKLERL